MARKIFQCSLMLLLSTCVAANARELPIGQYGVTISVGEEWQRATLNPDLGPDQFMHEDGLFCIIVEKLSLLERRADFEATMAERIAMIEARADSIDLDPLIEYRHDGETGHCTRRLNADLRNMNLAYQLDLISRDGLGYMLLSWSPASSALELHQQASALAAHLTFPAADSDWGQTAVPTPHRFRLADWQIDFNYRESVFPTLDEEDARVSLTSGAEDTAIHLFLDEYEEDPSLDEAMNGVIEAINGDDELIEFERIKLDDQPAGNGLQVLLRSREGIAPYDVAVAVIKVAERTFVDLRLVSSGAAGHRDALWSNLLASVQVTPPVILDAFPTVDTSPDVLPDSLDPAAHALLSSATRLASVSYTNTIKPAADGDLIVLETNRILRIAASSATTDGPPEPEILYEDEDWISSWRLAVRGDSIFLVNDEHEVMKLENGQMIPAECTAEKIVAAGSNLILVRTTESTQILGFGNLPDLAERRLVVRDSSGAERLLRSLEDFRVTTMAGPPDDQSESVLLALQKQRVLGANPSEKPSTTLQILDLESGATRQIGVWRTIRAIQATTGGWLVSGIDKTGTNGLFLLDPDGSEELLIGGAVTGAQLRNQQLDFTAPICLNDEGHDYGTCLYRSDLATVRQHGPASWSLTADIVNRIAAALSNDRATPLESGASRVDLQQIMEAANQLCLEQTSLPLPSSPATVDRLLRDLAGDDNISDAGLVLLAVVMSDAMLDDGAEWVDSSASPIMKRNGSGLESANHFAIAFDPVQVVVSALYQEEGWWNPGTSLNDLADGRTLLLGLDHSALQERVLELEDPAIESLLIAGKTRKLGRALEKHSTNHHLRVRVYEALAATGRSDDLVQLAAPFATIDDPDSEDLRAWLAGRLAIDPQGTALSALEDDLKTAIAQQPELPALYLMLGSVYEKGNDDNRHELARACYRKALDIQRWGPVADTAKVAIARLDEEDGADD